jgi:tRNA dimethylallyltransferase
MFDAAVILTGPTGCGKSALALDLADRVGGEVVSADSMTVYRGMDIGTAKPSAADRARVPHHLIDVLDPAESANVAWWLAAARDACADVTARGKVPMLVGGTPFYLMAVLHGLFDAPPADEPLRRRLEAEPPADLHARLAAVDPPTAARLHPNDVRRVVRALEVFTLTGTPISRLQQTWSAPAAAVPVVVLDRPRDDLYRRTDARVDAMLAAGWVDECRRLLNAPIGREAGQALGYPDLFAHLAGTGPGWEETVAHIRTKTRQFAKRQLTWFRRLPGAVWVPAGSGAADRVVAAWAERRAGRAP